MSLNDARRFVEKTREDRDFRNKAAQTEGQENLYSLLQDEVVNVTPSLRHYF